MKILFCGTPQFAKTILEAIHTEFCDSEIHVVSAPDRRSGRGMTLVHPPVAQFALEHNLPLYQPETLRDNAFLATLDKIGADVAVVAAYGKILPPYFLNHPRYGCMNVHASLLPEYRGASPIHRAIWDQKTETGITIMQMDDGLDTGDILLQEKIKISDADNTETLTAALAALGSKMICRAISMAFEGTLSPHKQDNNHSTYAAKLSREDEPLNFSLPAKQLHCQIRALAPRPYASAKLPDGTELKVCSAKVSEIDKTLSPGTVFADKKHVRIACGEGSLELLRVKPQGKAEMDAISLINGRKLKDGDLLS